MAKVAFLGLGVMGGPMAGHLATAGHTVTVYNRTPERALTWVAEHGNQAAPTPAEAVEGAQFVMVCVGNDDDLRSVLLGAHGALAAMSPGAVLVDHTTASANVAREIAERCVAHQVGFVDAPISGGEVGAQQGTLTVMCGADDTAVYDAAAEVIGAYARHCKRLGGAGAGQTTKMVNQICIAGTLQGLAEAVKFASAAGLDLADVVETISHGAAGSWQMENRAVTMAEGKFDFGFALEWMRKDLGICLDEADNLGVPLPVTAMVDQFYAKLVADGESRSDTSALIKLL